MQGQAVVAREAVVLAAVGVGARALLEFGGDAGVGRLVVRMASGQVRRARPDRESVKGTGSPRAGQGRSKKASYRQSRPSGLVTSTAAIILPSALVPGHRRNSASRLRSAVAQVPSVPPSASRTVIA